MSEPGGVQGPLHSTMKKILVTNDDGVRSEGIHELARAVARLGEVVVVAPNVEASAIGHALTLRRPLRVEQREPNVYEVDGTPTDCVNVAITRLLDAPPDLILSGINKGYNLGDDVTYSGTVAGAMEGALLGIPSIAVSLERTRGSYDFRPAAAGAAQVAERILAGSALPARTFLNINVPARQAQGHPHHRAGEAATTSPSSTSAPIRAARTTTGSRKGRTTGSRTTGRTTRRCATGSCRSRRCRRT